MYFPTGKRNYLYWWKFGKFPTKIYKPYYFHNKRGKVWGINIPFIFYFSRYYGKIDYLNLPEEKPFKIKITYEKTN